MAAVKTQEISAKKQPENWPSSLLILQSRPPAGVSWELQSPKGGGVKGQVYKTFLSEACSDSGLKIATAAQARGSPHGFLEPPKRYSSKHSKP